MWSRRPERTRSGPRDLAGEAGGERWSQDMGWDTAMKYLLANWKMHTTVEQAVALVQVIQEGLRERTARGRQLPGVIVCPPF
ncbi:MAG: hypothetical protein ABR540_18340, partial [Acidimicrobiales bacterium]